MGQVNTLVGLTWRAGAPTLTLVAPDGRVYTRAAPGAQDSAFVSAPGQRLPGGAVGAVALLLPHPLPGLWRVRIGNLRGGEGYHVEVRAERPAAAPLLRVLRPAAGQRLVARPAAPSVALAGTVSGVLAGSAVSLYYTSRPTLRLGGQVVPNTTGTLIADPVPVRNGRWSYRWDTSAVPSGTYDVYATLDSGAGGAVTAYAGGTVRVEQPLRPEAPRAVVALALPHTGSLEALWAPPVRAVLLAGYRLHWRLLPSRQAHGTGTSGGRWRTLDVGLAQSADLAGLEPGRAYQVAVSAYDSAGHESVLATARTLVLPRLANHPRPARGHAPRPQGHAQRGGAQQGSAPHRQGPHRSPSGRALPGATFALGASALHLMAGGDARLPLRVRPRGRARGDGGDYVELSVAGAPDGLLAQPLPGAVDLFAQGQGALAPALQIVTSPTLAPGRYTLVVTARQHLSGRVVVARVRVLVTPGATPPPPAGSPTHHGGVGSLQSALLAGALPTLGGLLDLTHLRAPHSVLHPQRASTVHRGGAALRRLAVVRIAPLWTLARGHGRLRPRLALAATGGDCPVPQSPSTVAYNNAQFPLPGEYQRDADGNVVLDNNRQPIPSTFVKADDLANGFAAADDRRLERFRPNPSAPGGYDRPNGQTDYGQGYLLAANIAAGSTPQGATGPYPADFRLTAFFGRLDYVPAVDSGLPLDANGQPVGFDTDTYCLQHNGAADCTQIGRPTGVLALLSPQSIRSSARGFPNRGKDLDADYKANTNNLPNPPGIERSDGTVSNLDRPEGYDRARGHLLGYLLGGPAKDPRNFVTQEWFSNSYAQANRETYDVAAALSPAPGMNTPMTGQMLYSVTPLYRDSCAIPYEVDLRAIGNNGWQFTNIGTASRDVANRRSQLVPQPQPAVVRIDNTIPDPSDPRHRVVIGQRNDARCVPDSYDVPVEGTPSTNSTTATTQASALIAVGTVPHLDLVTLSDSIRRRRTLRARARR